MKCVDGGLQWTDTTTLKGLPYADDICLMGDIVDSVVALSDILNAEGKKMSSNIIIQKSKDMKLITEDERSVTDDGHSLERIKRFVNLSSTECEAEDVRSEVRTRMGETSSVFYIMKNVWSSSGITQKTKVKLFNALVMSVML